MPKFTSRRFARELDAAWILAIWKAIHGGDPSPEQIAMEAIAALSDTLTSHGEGTVSESSFAELQTRLKEIGVELQQQTRTGGEGAPSTEALIIQYCIVVKGFARPICIDLPRPFVWRTHW